MLPGHVYGWRTAYPPGTLPAAAGRTAYRVVQEGLTNARKHAPGQPVQVVLDGHPGGHLLMEITNPLCDSRSAPLGHHRQRGGPDRSDRTGPARRRRTDQEITANGEFRLCARLPWPT